MSVGDLGDVLNNDGVQEPKYDKARFAWSCTSFDVMVGQVEVCSEKNRIIEEKPSGPRNTPSMTARVLLGRVLGSRGLGWFFSGRYFSNLERESIWEPDCELWSLTLKNGSNHQICNRFVIADKIQMIKGAPL